MADVLVIGYGNPLRGDDGIGWRAADELEKRWAGHGLVRLSFLQLTPEMADDVAGAAAVLFIDASCDIPPGAVDCREVEPTPAGAPRSFTHHMKPDTLLALARDLFGRAPRAWLITAGAADFECGERLTPAVEDALPLLVERAGEILRQVLPPRG